MTMKWKSEWKKANLRDSVLSVKNAFFKQDIRPSPQINYSEKVDSNFRSSTGQNMYLSIF